MASVRDLKEGTVGFEELPIKREYRSLLDDVIRDFYTPVLKKAVFYRRAVGFFSSSSLVHLTDGIRGLIENGGKIEVIASPELSEEDIEAIRDGFSRRNEIIKECLMRELRSPRGRFEEARLNLLSNLIASGILTIRIAFLESGNSVGMFHEKLGLMYDNDGNIIAFSGSMNESANAFYQNYESIDVFTSWSLDAERVFDKQTAFNAMWEDYEPGIKVLEFPEISNAIIDKYRKTNAVDCSDLEITPNDEAVTFPAIDDNIPKIPGNVKLRDYQIEAIENWDRAGFKGIFDMATGTGKTFTALAAIAHLSERLQHNLATVIVCPYQHLVEQWKDDAVAFGLNPIICYSDSSQSNWKSRVKNSVSGFRMGAIGRFCVITTNATFSTSFMQEHILKLRENCLLVADEAHNFGAEKLSAALPQYFQYRLALSATITRHGDEDGTASLFGYFGQKCIEYTLEDAINNGMLTPYYYHPVLVNLAEDELDKYVGLSKKISKSIASSKNKSIKDLPDSVKTLLIRRARIVAGAKQKIPALKSVIEDYADKNHILVYCGATTVSDVDYAEGVPTESEIRQIDIVSRMLGKDLGMKVSQFTSRENAEKREILKREFSDGKHQQALIAIRCLDEGVNIPSIETAFVLASSTNPKEYIQRRGRVLRLAPGKRFATIYDFVTLPIPLDDVDSYPSDVVESSKSLAARELVRMKDFARISENPAEILALASEIVEKYKIVPSDEEGEFDA